MRLRRHDDLWQHQLETTNCQRRKVYLFFSGAVGRAPKKKGLCEKTSYHRNPSPSSMYCTHCIGPILVGPILVFPWHDIVLSLRPCLTSVHTVSSTTVHSYSSALVLYCLSLPLALCSLLFVCIWLSSIRPIHLLGVWHKSTCVGPPVWCARRFQLHCCPDLLSLPDPT
jgi:hypothetical protein